MMNLSVTGKKMATPLPQKKLPDTNSPFIIQSKPISQKPASQIKPKPTVTHTPKVTPKKETPKITPKKEVEVKQQQKIEKKENPPTVVEQKKEEKAVQAEIEVNKQEVKKQEQVMGKVTVRYNHYKQDFPTVNGVLSFLPIQQKYSFSDVFRGKFIPVLKIFKTNEEINAISAGLAVQYSWRVSEDNQYRLQIMEDDDQELKYERKAYKASDNPNHCPFKKNARFEQLTEQMKRLDASELGSEKHRALLQQRDLEDILYS